MKKLFVVLAVASLGFVSCNNESETTTETDTLTNKDTGAIVPPTPVDTVTVKDTTMAGDTLKK